MFLFPVVAVGFVGLRDVGVPMKVLSSLTCLSMVICFLVMLVF